MAIIIAAQVDNVIRIDGIPHFLQCQTGSSSENRFKLCKVHQEASIFTHPRVHDSESGTRHWHLLDEWFQAVEEGVFLL
ncbi:hypothetical protein pipiens_009825 [Culex pipiens pipiens]|uniref:Uncharacterized protein n=1 Tax=Culex pipiens pipiens TaxID=38569 RepID=A0ABD1DG17_CULPP